MPSQEHLEQKQAIISEISDKMDRATGVVIIDYIGITVEEANTMRGKLRDAGVDYKIYKNTLVRRAIDGTPHAGLADVLEGPSAFAFGYDDATAPARLLDGVIREFRKMEFKAGIVEGVLYDAAGIKQIATIPSRDVLIARFLGSVQSPLSKLVRTFAAIADEKGGDAAEEEKPAPAEEAAPADEAPAEEAPAEEAADEAPAEEAVADEAPAEEAVAEAPAEEAPVEEEAAAEEAAEEAAADEAPAEETVAEETAEETAEEAPPAAPEEE
ncbi:MAG: 50S ribosomal protein L10 [Clostridiales bacterium]|nr:50S ribosomal protein L10 [Clostridiales bacterium]